MTTESTAEIAHGLFSPQGRMTRMRYIAYSGGLSFLIMLAVGIAGALLGAAVPGLGMIVVTLGYIAVFVLVVLLTIKRCHDFNVTGWLALVLIIPLAALIFWIIPGTEGDNRFGPAPPPNSTAVRIVAWIIIGLAVLSAAGMVLAPGVMMTTMEGPA